MIRIGSSSARRTIAMPVFSSSSAPLPLSSAFWHHSSDTPPPGTMPSSTALHATRAAVEEGIVPGGGVSLLWCQKALDKVKGADDDEKSGIAIIRRALEEPIRIDRKSVG